MNFEFKILVRIELVNISFLVLCSRKKIINYNCYLLLGMWFLLWVVNGII